MKTSILQNNRSQLLGLASLAMMIASHAQAQTPLVSPMIELGAGMEQAVSRGGTNLLLRVEAGVGLGGNPCDRRDAICQYRMTQMVIMHVQGEVAVNPGESGWDAMPRFNIRFTPLAIPPSPQRRDEVAGWIGRYGIDRSFHISALPMQLTRDQALRRDSTLRVNIVGVDAAVQTFPTEHFGIFAQAAADLLGFKYMNQENFQPLGMYDATAFSVGQARAEAGMIFAPNETIVVRISGGASYEYANEGQTGPDRRSIHDLEVFGDLRVSLTRFVEIFGRIATRRLYHDGFVPNDYIHVSAGLNVTWDHQ